MKTLSVKRFSILLFTCALLLATTIKLSGFSLDIGSLKSGQKRLGTYGLYAARAYKTRFGYTGETLAYWRNGGGGSVSVVMNHGRVFSTTGGQLEPNKRPTRIIGYGLWIQDHRYIGGPAY